MADTESGEAAPQTRAGYVALVGCPNVGKSTLMNGMTGENLSIVTPRAQTTRERVVAIYTTDRAQVLFVDTPGLLQPERLFQESMLESARSALRGADTALLILDATRPEESTPPPAALELVRGCGPAPTVAINKIDAAAAGAVEQLSQWSGNTLGAQPFHVSARTAEGTEALREHLIAALPLSPFLFPPDQIAVQPVRFFVEELIRETIFEEYREEVPYASVVRIEEYREAEDPLYIRATIYVERKSQKGIVIGRGGSAIKRLGRRARRKIEEFVGTRVYLDLWVKPMPGWRKKRGSLEHLGYGVPAEGS